LTTGGGIGILLFKPWENRHYTLALDHGMVLFFLRVLPLASRFFKKYGKCCPYAYYAQTDPLPTGAAY